MYIIVVFLALTRTTQSIKVHGTTACRYYERKIQAVKVWRSDFS